MSETNSTHRAHNFVDLTGKRFGKWTVVTEVDCPSKATYWLCRCTCGTEKSVRGSILTGNESHGCKPCGNRQHGMRYTPEYASWGCMKQRCHNPKSEDFPAYGGNGKIVCARWLESFENFFEDMGTRPAASCSVDRIDGSLGYSCGHCDECVSNGWPANCRWATPKEQARNTRTNRLIEYDGRTQCLAAWADEVGISQRTLYQRLSNGWSVEKALTTPVKQSAKRN